VPFFVIVPAPSSRVHVQSAHARTLPFLTLSGFLIVMLTTGGVVSRAYDGEGQADAPEALRRDLRDL
jgi:hypothetical protein